MNLRSADVLRRIRPDPTVDVSESVEAAHRRQATVDRRRRQSLLLHPTAVQLDVRTRRREYDELVVRRPLEEPAQVVAIGIQGAAAVAGQERDSGELRVIDDEVVCRQLDCRRRGLDGGHGCCPPLHGRTSQLRSRSAGDQAQCLPNGLELGRYSPCSNRQNGWRAGSSMTPTRAWSRSTGWCGAAAPPHRRTRSAAASRSSTRISKCIVFACCPSCSGHVGGS